MMNISNITSSHTEIRDAGFWFRHVVPMIIIPFGLFGNTLSIVILSKKAYINVSTFYYMRGLAFSDNFVMIMFFIRWLNYLPNSPISHDKWFCMFYFICIRIGLGSSAWILLMMSFDRYQRVRHPLNASKYCTIKRARISITVILIVYVLFHLPQFWRRPDSSGKTLQTQCPYNLPESFTSIYMIVRTVLVDCYIPWIFSLGFAIAMTCHLNRYENERVRRFSRSSADTIAKKVTLAAICATWAFFILAFPFSVYLTIRMAIPKEVSIITSVGYEALVFTLFLNSAINFYIYLLIMGRFRAEFKDLFKRKSTLRQTSSAPTLEIEERSSVTVYN